MRDPDKRLRRMRRITVAMAAVGALSFAAAAGSCARGDTTAPGPDPAAPIASALGPRPAFARPGGEAELPDVAERVVRSVVNISSEKIVRETGSPPNFGPFLNDPFFRRFFHAPMRPNGQPRQHREHSLGSGVIVSSDGLVLTNNHVVEKADEVRVALADGREFDAELVGTDPDSDLGVLRLKGKLEGLEPLVFGDSDALRLGEVVLAVGNPFGVGQTVTMGIVSAKGRASVGIVEYEDFIQTDAAINPGNSGGALVNMRGELVGVNTAILSRTGGYQGIGFSIPSKMAEPIMKSLVDKGTVERGWLGVAIQDVTPELSQALGLETDQGVLLADVNEASPAAKAGLRRGDVIVAMNDHPIDSSAHLRNAVAVAGGGAKVTVEIVREGKRRSVSVELGKKDSKAASASPTKPGRGDALGGLALADADPQLRRRFDLPANEKGPVVTRVDPGSAAARAGFRPGDVILEVDRQAVRSAREVEAIRRKRAGTLAVLVRRGSMMVYLALGATRP